MNTLHLFFVALVATARTAVSAAAAPDLAGLDRIIDEGMNHGEVIDAAESLADRIGGRMTNSPAMRGGLRRAEFFSKP